MYEKAKNHTIIYSRRSILRKGNKNMHHSHKGLHMLTFTLLVIGGLNWLVLALFNWEVGQLFGGMDAVVSKVIYVLVGLSAVYEAFGHGHHCKECKPEMSGQM